MAAMETGGFRQRGKLMFVGPDLKTFKNKPHGDKSPRLSISFNKVERTAKNMGQA
jgi:hypothetical protein